MSDLGGGESRYDIVVDTGALNQIEGQLALPFERGTKRAEKEIKGLESAVKVAARATANAAAQAGAKTGQAFAQGIAKSSPQVQAALLRAANLQQRIAAQAAQQQARAAQQAAAGASRIQLAQVQAQGKQQAAITQGIAQQQVIATRVAGQQRVAITRAFLDTIGRLERALGAVVTGVASTIVSATRRIFAGTVGSIQRSFAERRSTITRELRIEQGLFANAAAVQTRASRGLVGFGLGAAGLIGGGAIAAGAIRQIFTLGSQFTRGLNVLQAQLGLTDQQMKAVSDTAIQLGNDITLPGVSALDAAGAINLLAKQFAQLGPAALTSAQAAAKGTLQLARATGASAEEAAQAVGTAVNVFTKDAPNATAAADSIAFALSKAAGTSFTDFEQAFTQAAAVFASFQNEAVGGAKSLDEFNAAIAILAKGGLVGSDAGTSLRNFFTQANRGSKESVAAIDELVKRSGETGSLFFDAQGKARTFAATIDILQRGVAGLSQEQRNSALQTIFGTDALRAANILVDNGAAAYQQLADAVGKEGFAAKLAAAQNKGLAGAFDAIKSQFETFGILIFQKVNKPLGDVGLKIASFIDKLANAGGVFAQVRAGLKGIAAALGGLAAIKGFIELTGLLRSFAAFLGPIGVTAIIVGGALGFLLKRFGSFSGILDAVGRLIERVAPAVANLRGIIFDFLSGLAQRATFLGRFRGFLSQIFDLLGQGKMAQAFDRLKVAASAFVQNLSGIGRALSRIKEPIQKFLAGDFVGAAQAAKDVATNFVNVLAATIRNVGARLDPVTSLIGGFVSRFRTQLIGAGIGAVAGGIIGGPLGVAVGAALGIAISNAIGKLRGILGRVDVGALFGKFLNGVQEVGRRIGSFLSDERTLLAAAGIAAAAAAIAGRFVVGFVSGLLGHAGDIAAAFGKIFQAALTAPSIVKSVAALAILIRGVLTDQFKQANFGQILTQQVNKGLQQAAQGANAASLADKLKAGFTTAGKVAGQALSIGIAAALSGSALGSASNNLEKGLGIAGIAGSAAAAFAAVGGGPQGAVAAAATAGLGLLTAALTANAKKAAEAKAAMQDYKGALDAAAAAGKTTAQAISEIFGANAKKATDAQLQSIKDLGINLADFQAALAQGKGAEFLDEFTKKFRELQDLSARGAAAGGSFLSRDQRAQLDDLRVALPFLAKQVNAVNDAGKRRDLENSLVGINGKALITKAGLLELAKKAKETVSAQKKIGEAIATDRVKASLDVVKTGFDTLKTAAQNARQAALDALLPKAKALPQAEAGATTAVSGFGSQLEGVDTGTRVGKAILTGLQGDLSQQLNEIIVAAATEANPGQAIADSFAGVRQDIANSSLSADIQAAFNQTIDDAQAAVSAKPLELAVITTANLQEAAAAGDAAATAALVAAGQTGPISIKSKADAVAAGLAGEGVFTTADTFATRSAIAVKAKADEQAAQSAGKTIHSQVQTNADKPIKVGSTVTASTTDAGRAGNAIAKSVMDGFSSGISSSSRSINRTVSTTLNGVTQVAVATFRIGSPSKVFQEIGEDVMAGLVKGLREGGPAAISAIQAVAKDLIDSTKSVASGISSALGDIFSANFERSAILGGGNSGGAIAAFNQSVHDVFFTVNRNFDRLWEIAAKEAGARTLEERLLQGEAFNSLRIGDEFGRLNRAAIVQAVDAIKAIGSALLEQGFSAQQAADQLLAYRQQLVGTAVQAGLAQGEVEALLNSLGLSAAGLQTFVQQANRLNQIVASGGNQPPPPSLTTGPNPTQQFITNNIYLPTGDPEANALAVVNRQALAVR